MVQDALDKIMKANAQTTIVVAHRLSTIRNADRIAVIGAGVVQEIGTWDQLMSRQDGHFRRMSIFQSLDGHKKDINTMLAPQVQVENKPKQLVFNAVEEQNAGSCSHKESARKNNPKRARLLAKGDAGVLG